MKKQHWVWSAGVAVGIVVALSVQVTGQSFEVISIKKLDLALPPTWWGCP